MGFFSRLKWLFTGEGEAPSSYKASAPFARRPEAGSSSRPPHGRDRDHRGPRDREGRDSRGDRYSREPRDSRLPRESREPRDRQPRSGYDRDGGDRFSERNRGGQRRSGSQGGYSRRDSSGGDGGYPRQIERPSGGPSSTMRPAQSSVSEGAPVTAVQAARPEAQGPEKVGAVTHYYDQARVASIKIEKGLLRNGDWIEIQGNISSLRQKVDSMQMNNEPIQEACEGQEVGIRVIRPVKAGDGIVRLRG